jgi:hypothetical protein
MTGWSNSWDTPKPWPEEWVEPGCIAPNTEIIIEQERLLFVDKNAIYEITGLDKVYNNKVPTHDPYTNPTSHIYYQCNCGKILDPSTHSFAALNNYASDKGWKVRWNKDGMGYEPFCEECGKDVE